MTIKEKRLESTNQTISETLDLMLKIALDPVIDEEFRMTNLRTLREVAFRAMKLKTAVENDEVV